MSFTPAIAAVMAAVSTAVGVGGSIMSGIGQANAAAANAKAAQANAAATRQAGEAAARQAQVNADIQAQVTRENERRMRVRQEKLLASQEVGYAKSGVMLEGTPLEVMADTAAQTELDILQERWKGNIAEQNLRQGARTTLYNSEIEAGRWESRGALFEAEGSRGMTAGLVGAGTTLLNGASNLYTNWGSWNKKEWNDWDYSKPSYATF